MPKATEPVGLETLRRLRDDLPHFAARCLEIRTKSGAIRPLVLNRAQRHVHRMLEAQRARTGKVRALVLKARQQGFSTYIGARFYHRAALNRGQQVFILTHEQEAAETLFSMVGRFHAGNPLAPVTGAANARALRFERLGSGYSIGTAGAQAVGRSKPICQAEPVREAPLPHISAAWRDSQIPDLVFAREGVCVTRRVSIQATQSSVAETAETRACCLSLGRG